MTFNKKYGIENSDGYINIELDTDNKMFVDPYLIYIDKDEMSTNCSNRIVNYFSQLLKAAEKDDFKKGEYLVKYLQENNEVRLGYSNDKPHGKGLGKNKGIELFDAIKESKAVKSGLVEDIFDASIMLNNVGYDKISDLTICIILEELIAYTQTICKKHNIEMKPHKLNRPVWSHSQNKWTYLKDIQLPSHNDKPIILIPNKYAKKILVYTYNRFYNYGMMPYYEKIAFNNPSMGLVKILKRGIVPAKTKIRKKYPCKKDDVLDFIIENPDVYLSYKEKQIKYITNDSI